MSFFISIFFLLMLAYALLIDRYRRIWNNIPIYDLPAKDPSTFISVIIAARNEENNIPGLLSSLEQQTYPRDLFQVIVVDDHSTDETPQLLYSTQCSFSLAPIIISSSDPELEKSQSYKKNAIDLGIGMARGKLIVTTDADCRFDKNWLAGVAAFYESTGAKFIAAPVMIKSTQTVLSVFQSLDFLTLQGITGASVHSRFHSMCNGANLAYEREAFYEVKGFEGIDQIPSGDDMFLMHKIYKKYPDKVFYLKAHEAIVQTEAATSWKAFFQQRIRWASKADRYEDKRIFWVLLLVYLLNICFLVLGIASFWKNTWLFFLVILLLAKILIEFPFVNAVAIFFKQDRLMKYFIFLQPIHILYTIIAGWLGKFSSYEWKGRRIRK
jgi:cellulose synthase/poly-beta-1,6-N-acetylglucosamine synthase-like glycosyltransferase